MPNLDSGRYFLTTMFPIKNGPLINMEIGDDQVMPLLPVQMVRHMLSVGATAQQGPATYWQYAPGGTKKRAEKNSHFAKNIQTHFTRFFVIDNAIYNGRNPSNVVTDKLRGLPVVGRLFGKVTNLLDPEQVDQLSNPFLVWVAEIDAPLGREEELDQYLEDLWQQMPDKLSELFIHCHGFDAEKMNAGNFKQFVRLGQVETVMPFNDYWQTTPELDGFFATPQSLPTKIAAVFGGLTTVFALLGTLRQLYLWISTGSADTGWWFGFFLLSLLLTLGVTVFLAYRGIMNHGKKPFPMPLKSDLKSVLKSLYLQQELTDFAITNQGCKAQQLHDEFGKFLEQSKPESVKKPTQQPGTIRAERKMAS